VSFYSPIDRLAQNLPRPKGTGAEFMTELSKMPGYKAQEAEDRGLQALTNLPKMERAQFMEALKSKPPVVPQTHELSGDYGGYEPHHEQYTLPGGTNYREILLQHPKGAFKGVEHHFDGTPNILASVRVKDRMVPGEMGYTLRNKTSGFKSRHHKTLEEAQASIQNYPEHFRSTLDVVPNKGPDKKILHIEELQSDWHQQGRDKGYTPPDVAKQISAAERTHRELQRQLNEAKQNAAFVESGLSDPTTKRMRDLNPEMIQRLEASKIKHNNTIMELLPQVMKAEAAHQDLLHQSKNTVPDAPFKKNWHEMALKKMIHHAAANGYDAIAITPGREQADRYGLAQHVGLIRHMTHGDNPNSGILFAYDPQGNQIVREDDVPHEKLSEYIGREGAKKLMDQKPDGVGYRELSGENLQVGGEGMKGFYDKIVPNFLNQFGKKYGAKVGQIQVPVVHALQGLRRVNNYPDDPPLTLHHFPITPEMREDVVKNGVPLYAKGGGVEVKPTVKDETIQRKIPEMEEAAKALQAGTITRAQYDKVVKQHKPVKPYEFVPQPATDEDAERALMANKKAQWRGHEQWPAGRKVGLRLDIPAYENHGVWVNSIHDEEGNGEDKYPTAYNSVSSVKNATFDAKPEKAVRVATGEQNKSPFARIRGELHHMTEDEAVEHMKAHLNHPDYVQVGMDPRRHGYFYDRKTMKPITHSAHVVQIGPLVLAHKPTYGKRETYAKGGDVHSGGPEMGINVRSDKKANLQYADLIVDGHKTYESRNGDTLRPYVGKRVSIVRTGDGPAKAIGAVTVGEPIVVDRKKFRKMEKQHLVPEGSAFDIASGTKHLYPMHEPERSESERDVGHGIVARKVHMADGGPVPPLRPLNPQLAALREQFAAQSALHKAYNEAMKNVYTNQMPTFKDWVASQGKAKGGSIKPVGYTKEQVTVSPNLDAMRYELMSVKRYTKKVK